MRKLILISAVSLLALAGCAPAPTPAASTTPAAAATKAAPLPTEDEVLAGMDKVLGLLMAGDTKGAVALNASDAVLFDPGMNTPITTVEENQKATDAFMSMGVTKMERHWAKAQVLGPDVGIVTTTGTLHTKTKGMEKISYRSTDVLKKRADGEWIIVNEHLSMMPEPVKAPLPVIKTFDAPAVAPSPSPTK